MKNVTDPTDIRSVYNWLGDHFTTDQISHALGPVLVARAIDRQTNAINCLVDKIGDIADKVSGSKAIDQFISALAEIVEKI